MKRVPLAFLLRALPLLVLAAGGAAFAAGTATCSVLDLPDADPNNPQALLSLTTFVPDAGCWYTSTIEQLADAGVFQMTASFARYLVAILFGIYGLTALLDVKARAQAIKMVLATVVVGSLLATPADRNSTTNYIRVFMLDSWPTIYQTAADWSEKQLGGDSNQPGSLGNYVRSLMEQMATLEYNATVFERVRGKINTALESNQLGSNTEEIKENVYRIIEEDRAKNKPVFDNMQLWTTIGSFLVMGLFTVFAALIYSTAINLIMSALLLPIQIAFIGVLQWGYFTKSMIGYISSLLTTVLVSVFSVLVMDIAIGAPATAMASRLADANNLMTSKIQEYALLWEKCGFDLGYATCQITNLALDINVQANSVRSMVVTLGAVLLMAVVASGIAMNQLRRVPAMIASAVGVSAGGESSGTGANPMTALAKASGVAVLGQQLQRSMMNSSRGSSGSPSSPGASKAAAPAAKSGESTAAKSSGETSSGAGAAHASEGPAARPSVPPEAEGAAEGKSMPPSFSERAAGFIANVPDARGMARNAAQRTAAGAKAMAMRHPSDRAVFEAVGKYGGNAAVDGVRSGAQIMKEQGVQQGVRTIASNAQENLAAVSVGVEARAQRLGAERRDAAAQQSQARTAQWTEQAARQGFDTPAAPSEPPVTTSAATSPTPNAESAGTARSGAATGPAARATSGAPSAASGGRGGPPAPPQGSAPQSAPPQSRAGTTTSSAPAAATGKAAPVNPLVNDPAGSPTPAPATIRPSGGFGSGTANTAPPPPPPAGSAPSSAAASSDIDTPKVRPLHRSRAADTAAPAPPASSSPAPADPSPPLAPPAAPAPADVNTTTMPKFTGDSRANVPPPPEPPPAGPRQITDFQPASKATPAGGTYVQGADAPPAPTPPSPAPNAAPPQAFSTPQSARLSPAGGAQPAPRSITVPPAPPATRPDTRDLGAYKADAAAQMRAGTGGREAAGSPPASAPMTVDEARHLAPVTSPDAPLPNDDTIGEPPRS